ncbi:DNA mismatch repair endonuclease MutL [Rubeoparvulum massiliense]|uniref:DNA mismatch repair endonuclease MutL n=1 Tax=Rubeoparvulum massiliense TaxID=1631346 RepID=UPI00065E77BC|nr:DNA mismatch repair endonuclease MutL [Rubeoparvulum massiliense]
MSRIQRLDQHLINQIAAGEVVERPVSVVKELVENAIDAGSRRIQILVEEGGLKLIQVRDDGCGMSEADVRLAFERHATSKISRPRDLQQIQTLGFRGEALPSIASVAKVECKSCEEAGQAGFHLIVEGGTVVEEGPVGMPPGTEITVRDLFYNTPARLKYMKSLHTELGHIIDFVNRIALAHAEIAFLLIHEGRQLIQTYGNGDRLQVFASIYGTEVAKKSLAIHEESFDFQLDGLMVAPELNRSNRSYLSFFVNGRYIKNPALVQAILRAYHTLLPINRYPIGVLYLTMDPHLLDVNVHPAKLEVRFSKERELVAWVEEMVHQGLMEVSLIARPIINPDKERNRYHQEELLERRDWFQSPPAIKNQEIVNTGKHGDAQPERIDSDSDEREGKEEVEKEKQPHDFMGVSKQVQIAEQPSPYATGEVRGYQSVLASLHQELPPQIPPLEPLAQLHGTYLLCQNEEGLYIIDQHAAQERIFYEYILLKMSEEELVLQPLLVPDLFELTVEQVQTVELHRSLFEQMGVFLEPFGHQSYVLRAHPYWFPPGEERAIVYEMIDLLQAERDVQSLQFRETAAASMACKGAIKANRFLRKDEMVQLIEDLRRTRSPFTCPHGRPIIIHFSTYEIEKMFKRVM